MNVMGEDFETDFWKEVSDRATWNMIVPGELRETRPVTLTRRIIQDFARKVGEDNPLYFDEDHARSTPYGGLVAPPSIHILLMFACTTSRDWMRSPGTIRPGDTIEMCGTALDKFIKKDRLFAVHENLFTNQNGQVVCTGRGQTIRPL